MPLIHGFKALSIGFLIWSLVNVYYIEGDNLNLTIQILDITYRILIMYLGLLGRCAYGLVIFSKRRVLKLTFFYFRNLYRHLLEINNFSKN